MDRRISRVSVDTFSDELSLGSSDPGIFTEASVSPAPGASPQVDKLRKFKRVKHACDECRKRKARCSESQPCDNCSASNIHCSFTVNDPTQADKTYTHAEYSAQSQGRAELEWALRELWKRTVMGERLEELPTAEFSNLIPFLKRDPITTPFEPLMQPPPNRYCFKRTKRLGTRSLRRKTGRSAPLTRNENTNPPAPSSGSYDGRVETPYSHGDQHSIASSFFPPVQLQPLQHTIHPRPEGALFPETYLAPGEFTERNGNIQRAHGENNQSFSYSNSTPPTHFYHQHQISECEPAFPYPPNVESVYEEHFHHII